MAIKIVEADAVAVMMDQKIIIIIIINQRFIVRLLLGKIRT